MGNTISKYQVRLLNHRGDCLSLAAIIAVCFLFLAVKTYCQFPQLGSGPPVVLFEKVRPSGDDIFAYYNIPNPKSRSDRRIVDARINDPYLSHLSFFDVNKILPSSDAACASDGACKDDLQVLVQFKLKQSTDIQDMKSKAFFQLNLPKNISQSEEKALRELILKN